MKKSLKKSVLASALVGLGALAASGTASAVYVNGDGLGQALVYPYYTVRNDQATLFSLVNTTGDAKVVKIRFREGKNTADVLDWNVFLSPYDVYTWGALPAGDNGNGTGGAVVVSRDTSCTYPAADEFGNTFAGSGIPLRTFGFNGDSTDTLFGSTVDRTREGYVEVIEMGTFSGSNRYGTSGYGSATYGVAGAVTHGAGTPGSVARKPANCGVVASFAANDPANVNTPDAIGKPSGGLFGGATIVDVAGGSAVGYNATALNAFWDPAATTGSYFNPGSESPNMGNAASTSTVTNGQNTYISTWVDGWDAVSGAIMARSIVNEYAYTDVNATTGKQTIATDWVVTFPTKRHYTFNTFVGYPFEDSSYKNEDGSLHLACDTISTKGYDREEGSSTSQSGFSPRPPGPAGDKLCYEANVVSFGKGNSVTQASNALGSTNNKWLPAFQNNGAAVATPGAAAQGEGGWLTLTFPNNTSSINIHNLTPLSTSWSSVSGTTITPQTTNVTYGGLPVVGFSTTRFNAALPTGANVVNSSYGTDSSHRFVRDIR